MDLLLVKETLLTSGVLIDKGFISSSGTEQCFLAVNSKLQHDNFIRIIMKDLAVTYLQAELYPEK